MPERERFITLLEKYSQDKISPDERSEFLAAVISGNFDDLMLSHIEGNLQSLDIATTGTGLPPHRSADILHRILSSEKQNDLLIPKRSASAKFIRWAVAAAFVGSIVFSIYFFSYKPGEQQFPTSFPAALIEKKNTSARVLKVEMEEGSVITLQPGAVIHYPAHFLPNKREVFLEGEAFFDVSKNAHQPFYVHYKNIITHVLGTSFNVKMNNKTGQVEVSVRSGRVEVYESRADGNNTGVEKNNGVILLPNQKVLYDQQSRQFVPSLADVPLPIKTEHGDKEAVAENFVFDSTPLRAVIASLEKSYGVDIMVENENIYNCLFTGDVSMQELYTRLDIICQAVQASYEVKGTKILIKGNGCDKP